MDFLKNLEVKEITYGYMFNDPAVFTLLYVLNQLRTFFFDSHHPLKHKLRVIRQKRFPLSQKGKKRNTWVQKVLKTCGYNNRNNHITNGTTLSFLM